MAVLTGSREARGNVVGIRGIIVVSLMTEEAISGCSLILSVDMALYARSIQVGAGKGKLCLTVVKRGWRPGIGVVALRAGMVVLPGNMIGVGDALVVILMAGPAIRGQAIVLPTGMARYAVQTYMRAGKREIGAAVIVAAAFPVVGCMALQAIVAESSLPMIGIRSSFVIVLMA